ncbi:MAG: ankyrin repeat domain-containing protein [Phycisphaerales bacterium]|nr:ankyrin repeat domain-containing protein [Phycisphaerales bacterium]
MMSADHNESKLEVIIDRLTSDIRALRSIVSRGGKLPQTSLHVSEPALWPLLLELGAPINAEDENGWTPLVNRILNGDLAGVEWLVKHGADVNRWSSEGAHALMQACIGPRTDIVEVLLRAGADVNGRSPETGHTPLHSAAESGATRTVQRLLKAGADPNALLPSGDSPLRCLIDSYEGEESYYRKAVLLVGYGAKVSSELVGALMHVNPDEPSDSPVAMSIRRTWKSYDRMGDFLRRVSRIS